MRCLQVRPLATVCSFQLSPSGWPDWKSSGAQTAEADVLGWAQSDERRLTGPQPGAATW